MHKTSLVKCRGVDYPSPRIFVVFLVDCLSSLTCRGLHIVDCQYRVKIDNLHNFLHLGNFIISCILEISEFLDSLDILVIEEIFSVVIA